MKRVYLEERVHSLSSDIQGIRVRQHLGRLKQEALLRAKEDAEAEVKEYLEAQANQEVTTPRMLREMGLA